MAGVVFSKLSGKNDSLYKAVEGVLTEVIADTDTKTNKDDEVLKAIFNIKKSNKFGERVGTRTSLGNFKPMSEGGVFKKDEIEEGFAKLAVHKAFGSAFTVTHEMASDGDIDEAKMAAQEFVDSYKRSKLAFGTGYLTAEGKQFKYEGEVFDRTTGDGEGFFSATHKMKKSANTWSNVFTNKFGTNDDMINKLAVLGRNFKNDSGQSTGFTFDTIIIPSNTPELEKTVKALIASEQIVGSNNNDINIQKGKWRMIVNHAWEVEAGKEPYILMSSEAQKKWGALRWYDRETLDVRNWIDENTRNLEWSGYCRQSILGFMPQAFIMGGAEVGTTL